MGCKSIHFDRLLSNFLHDHVEINYIFKMNVRKLSVHKFHPIQTPPFAAVATSGLQVCLHDLGTANLELLSNLHDQTAPAPSGWIDAACVQRSLNHTRDSQVD